MDKTTYLQQQQQQNARLIEYLLLHHQHRKLKTIKRKLNVDNLHTHLIEIDSRSKKQPTSTHVVH